MSAAKPHPVWELQRVEAGDLAVHALFTTTGRPNYEKPLKLHFLADWHIGGETDVQQVESAVRAIQADPDAYVIVLGDMGDWIASKDDPRFLIQSVPEDLLIELAQRPTVGLLRLQAFYLAKYLEPIIDRVLLLLVGNHEMNWQRHNVDPMQIVLDTVVNMASGKRREKIRNLSRVVNMGPNAFLTIEMRRLDSNQRTKDSRKFCIYAFHGWGRVKYPVNQIQEVARHIEGVHIFVRGHSHKAGWRPIKKVRPRGPFLEEFYVHYLAIGSPVQAALPQGRKITYRRKQGYGYENNPLVYAELYPASGAIAIHGISPGEATRKSKKVLWKAEDVN